MNAGTHRTPDGHLLPRRLTTGVAASTLLPAPVACGGSDGGAGGTTSITVAIPPAVSGIDVYAAQAQGYFTQHHLKVKIKTVNGGSAIVPALASGAVQIGESNVLSVVQGASRGVKEPCIAGADTEAKVMSPQPDSEITPHPVYACWMASSSWLSHHKDVASRFTAALNEADQYMAAHPGCLSSILPKYTKVSAQLAGRVTLPDFATTMTPADVQPWSQAAAQFKVTDSVVPPASIITSLK